MAGVDIDVPGFSGHETFPFRYGWLKKAVDAAQVDPGIFSQDRALVYLGVGKNMVRSIRYWGLATGVLEERRTRDGCVTAVTDLGRYLFGDGGADPYLEDVGTLWLLHWKVVTNHRRATVWFWAFGLWHQPDFQKEWLTEQLIETAKAKGWRIARSSIARDVDCFVRTYVPSRSTRTLPEDSLDCPLTELGLIKEMSDRRTYHFVRGAKPSLSDAVFAYSLVDFWHRTASLAVACPFESIAYECGSPGRVFQLDENSVVERLERLSQLTGGRYTYGESAGIKQVLRTGDHLPRELFLRMHYEGSRR